MEDTHDADSGNAPKGTALVGHMGTTKLIFTVLSFSAPLGAIAGVVPLVISEGNGAGAPCIYALIGVVLVLFATGFTAMARVFPRTGAFYAYVTGGLGREAGMAAAFLALLGYVTCLVGMYAFFGDSINLLVGSFVKGDTVPWWIPAVLLWVAVAALGHFNVDLSGTILSVLMAFEVIIVMVFNLPVLFTGGPHGFQLTSFTPSAFTSGSVGIAILFAAATFIGFESTAVYRSEVKDPSRTVPRATYLAIILIGLFYVLSSWALVTFYGPNNVADVATTNGTSMFADGLAYYAGDTAAKIMRCLVVTSLFAATLAPHNTVARYVNALARDGVLPKALGKAHPKHGSPAIASAAVAVIVLILVLPFTGLDAVKFYSWMFGIFCYAILIVMTLTSLAVIVYLRRTMHSENWWRSLVAPGLGFVGLASFVAIIAWYFPLLIGGSTVLGTVLQVFIYGTGVVGFVLALHWKKARPDIYRRLGGQTGDPQDDDRDQVAVT
ncbi:hypothetical protein A5784_36090 [Mycobacterium sp. 852013-50091_SCH5140682]|uniref:APC family permease n=1 Tax=Mycobacterium sp. 852013-50091_SCH5140682 TaxID=1834109 RepID=UPI0007EB891A|nr:APC family permease [Mycobacterium sp. 852013-50091_SCH5140682]OBC10924.1 hypothetical protein A5784_36090 [Mycobacterium sp. 852013-50091_SCH5140682]